MGDASMMAASTAVSLGEGLAAHKHAEVNVELANAIKKINNQQVYESMLSSFRSLEAEQDQIDEAFVATSIDQQKAKARARGAAKVASGASGTAGSGLDMQLDEIDSQSAQNLSRMKMNRDRQMDSIKSRANDAENIANQRFDRMPDQKAPSLFATGLEYGAKGFRNAVSLMEFTDALDDNIGEDPDFGFSEDSTFDVEDLYDAPIINSEQGVMS